MKKILVIFIITLQSFFLFSYEDQIENKKLGIELKTMINAGYETDGQNGNVFLELDLSKRFDVEKINTIFNIGGGIDFASYFASNTFLGTIKTYILTEVGGYVSKDTRLYTNMKAGVGVAIKKNDNDNGNKVSYQPKFELGLGVLYKYLSVEASYNYVGALTLGIGARFGF